VYKQKDSRERRLVARLIYGLII